MSGMENNDPLEMKEANTANEDEIAPPSHPEVPHGLSWEVNVELKRGMEWWYDFALFVLVGILKVRRKN